jgi:hypothetical protein
MNISAPYQTLVLSALLTASCATRAQVIRALDSRQYVTLQQLEEATTAFVRDCNDNVLLRILEPTGKQLTLACVSGQVQVELPQCNGWDLAVEQGVINLGAQQGFKYYGSLSCNDCPAFGLHADRTSEGFAQRLMAVVVQSLNFQVAGHVWLQKEHYAYAKAS